MNGALPSGEKCKLGVHDHCLPNFPGEKNSESMYVSLSWEPYWNTRFTGDLGLPSEPARSHNLLLFADIEKPGEKLVFKFRPEGGIASFFNIEN